jgi:hypothetical protein
MRSFFMRGRINWGATQSCLLVPYKSEFSHAVEYFTRQVERLRIRVNLGAEASAKRSSGEADVVIVAAGLNRLFQRSRVLRAEV